MIVNVPGPSLRRLCHEADNLGNILDLQTRVTSLNKQLEAEREANTIVSQRLVMLQVLI